MNTHLSAEPKVSTPDQLIFRLMESFPCLSRKVGHWAKPGKRFDPDEFFELFDGASSGERYCALFVLNVWSHGYAEMKGWRFDLIEFIACADGENLQALLAWASNPFWP